MSRHFFSSLTSFSAFESVSIRPSYQALQTQGFWQAWIEDGNTRRKLQSTPLVNQIGKVFARFTDGFEHLAAIPATRQLLREAIVSRYFPNSPPIKIP